MRSIDFPETIVASGAQTSDLKGIQRTNRSCVANGTGSRIEAFVFNHNVFCSLRKRGTNQRNNAVAANAPSSWAITKPGTSVGRMPAKGSEAARAKVTAEFANEVEAVNQ